MHATHRLRLFHRACTAAVAALALLAVSPRAAATLVDAVEYYNAALDHYFVTASADEIAKLDNHVFVGWARTGLSFKVADPATVATSLSPVCRFYGVPSAGLDSHFYSASPAECQEVAARFPGVWILESSDVFGVALPDTTTGACPGGTVPIYRAWNNRVDSNHRYTTSISVQQEMIAKGYVAEGYGPPSMPVAMCSPTVDPVALPACTLTASNGFPAANSFVTLTATCSGNPSAYHWSNCASLTSICTASSATAGTVTYTVVASNVNGSGDPASVSVRWQAPPPPETPPTCAVSATQQTNPAVTGGLVTLYAYCSGDPTAYHWTGCTSLTNVCRTGGSGPGLQTVTVSATNSGGTGNTASASISWASSTPPPVGLCGQFPSALYSDVGSDNQLVYSTFFNRSPGFAFNGAWAVRFTVPSTASAGAFGSLSTSEFNGPPTYREVTVSSTACDFRATDLTGASGPLGRGIGNTATVTFFIGAGSPTVAGLMAGHTYYFNIRNYNPGNGTVTCSSSQARCDALANVVMPH
jgi:hypothetical protein